MRDISEVPGASAPPALAGLWNYNRPPPQSRSTKPNLPSLSCSAPGGKENEKHFPVTSPCAEVIYSVTLSYSSFSLQHHIHEWYFQTASISLWIRSSVQSPVSLLQPCTGLLCLWLQTVNTHTSSSSGKQYNIIYWHRIQTQTQS